MAFGLPDDGLLLEGESPISPTRATPLDLVRDHDGLEVALDQAADGDLRIGCIERPEFDCVRAQPTLRIGDPAGSALAYEDVLTPLEIVRGHNVAVLVQGHSGLPESCGYPQRTRDDRS